MSSYHGYIIYLICTSLNDYYYYKNNIQLSINIQSNKPVKERLIDENIEGVDNIYRMVYETEET